MFEQCSNNFDFILKNAQKRIIDILYCPRNIAFEYWHKFQLKSANVISIRSYSISSRSFHIFQEYILFGVMVLVLLHVVNTLVRKVGGGRLRTQSVKAI